MKPIYPLILIFMVLISSCAQAPKAHPPQNTTDTPPPSSNSLQSSIEIQYNLGRDHYRFSAMSSGDSITANTSVNKRILEKGSIDQNQYPVFLKKAQDFVQQLQRSPAQSQPCRSPFKVTLTIGNEKHIAQGCRSNDNGALSKLVRDGEFLLYSKN